MPAIDHLVTKSYDHIDNSYLALLRKTAIRDRRPAAISYDLNFRMWKPRVLESAQGHFPYLTEIQNTTFEMEEFCTGSSYLGEWNMFGMVGSGIYTLITGEVYEGEMKDNEYNGVGILRWPCGSYMDCYFVRGTLIKSDDYHFTDGHRMRVIPFCEIPDRRFYIERVKNLRPAGKSYLTDQVKPRAIPNGCYDTGDGFYNPITKCVYNPEDPSEILRIPTKTEHDWILANCRKAWDEVVGYRPELYEDWFL